MIASAVGSDLRLRDAANDKPLHTLEGHKGPITACAFSPDGRFIISASQDKRLRMWEVASGKPLHILEGHTEGVTACAYSPDGRFILSTSRDKTLRMWEAVTGHLLLTLEGNTLFGSGCAFSPDGRFMASTGDDKILRIWNPGNGEMLTCLSLPGALHSIGLHPTAPQMVCGDAGGAVYILEIVGLQYGSIILTAWNFTLRSLFRKPDSLAFGCPTCRTWSEISETTLGSEIPCPTCGKPVRLNSFTIQGDWHPIAEAWERKA
jgi:WD40 repeat protein